MGRAPVQRDRQALAPKGKSPACGGRVVGPADATERLSFAEAVVRLGSVYELERYSPLGDRPCLIVDSSAGAEAQGAAAMASAKRTFGELACPSVLIAAEPASGTIENLFDVVVSTDAELDAVLSGVERSPLASTALVQLLRASEGRSLHEALIAESFVYSTLQAGPEFRAWLEGHRSLTGKPVAGTPSAGSGPAVRIEREGSQLEVTLNRPERRNAFSVEMRDALVDALSLAVSDESVTDIILRGAGESFSAGGDLDEFGRFADPVTAHAIRSTRNAGRLLARCGGRVRAEVHGACVGAGAELPAFAGRVCARVDAFFELPEISMGLIPGAGGTASIPPRIGRQRTAYLALSGARLDAPTALAWGLVDAIT